MSDPEPSVVFDRAAEYYDESRGFSPRATAAMTALLAGELRGRGPTLEVGVGTGQVALPLREAGIPLVGFDLSRSMMERLVAKVDGAAPFPLVQADATRMPFSDDAFGGAYLRWVLHLIPAWPDVLTEIVRVVRPAGVFLALGGSYSGPRAEIQERFAQLAGISLAPVGLDWEGDGDLDDAMRALGAVPRAIPSFPEITRDDLDTFIDGIGNGRYSWTWKVADPELFARIAGEVRVWAEQRYGPLDRIQPDEFEVTWRAYDLSR